MIQLKYLTVPFSAGHGVLHRRFGDMESVMLTALLMASYLFPPPTPIVEMFTGPKAGTCIPGQVEPCEATGECADSTRTCNHAGTWDLCKAVDEGCTCIPRLDGSCCIPSKEKCGDGLDNDCDGNVDNGCPCAPSWCAEGTAGDQLQQAYQSDRDNCGGPGVMCITGTNCVEGWCVNPCILDNECSRLNRESSCELGIKTYEKGKCLSGMCVSATLTKPCETGHESDPENCGGLGVMCQNEAVCRKGHCVIPDQLERCIVDEQEEACGIVLNGRYVHGSKFCNPPGEWSPCLLRPY